MPTTEAPPLSIVIPVLNEAALLRTFLTGLRASFPSAELVLVDGGSRDHTVRIALREGATVLMSAPGRSRQMNLGAAAARAEWVLFLHADSRLTFGEADVRRELESAAGRNAWGFFSVKLKGRSRLLPVVAWLMNRRSRLTHVATGDQGLFLRTDAFRRLGGFAAIPLMEDVEICKRLRRLSAPLCSRLTLVASDRRWDEQGAMLTIIRMWALRLAYWCGVSPERLWQYYYGRHAPPAAQGGNNAHG
jgi:rSAM/selenodomain-associated transferase 2